MQYSCSIDIALPRDQVVALFDDPDNLAKWQDGLQSFRHLSGDYATPGSTYEVVYKMGRREVTMVETLKVRDLPAHLQVTYETKGVWNLVDNHFEDLGGTATRWRMETEFRCTGFIRLMAFFMPGMFRKQTEKMMGDFKRFAEAPQH